MLIYFLQDFYDEIAGHIPIEVKRLLTTGNPVMGSCFLIFL